MGIIGENGSINWDEELRKILGENYLKPTGKKLDEDGECYTCDGKCGEMYAEVCAWLRSIAPAIQEGFETGRFRKKDISKCIKSSEPLAACVAVKNIVVEMMTISNSVSFGLKCRDSLDYALNSLVYEIMSIAGDGRICQCDSCADRRRQVLDNKIKLREIVRDKKYFENKAKHSEKGDDNGEPDADA